MLKSNPQSLLSDLDLWRLALDLRLIFESTGLGFGLSAASYLLICQNRPGCFQAGNYGHSGTKDGIHRTSEARLDKPEVSIRVQKLPGGLKELSRQVRVETEITYSSDYTRWTIMPWLYSSCTIEHPIMAPPSFLPRHTFFMAPPSSDFVMASQLVARDAMRRAISPLNQDC